MLQYRDIYYGTTAFSIKLMPLWASVCMSPNRNCSCEYEHKNCQILTPWLPSSPHNKTVKKGQKFVHFQLHNKVHPHYKSFIHFVLALPITHVLPCVHAQGVKAISFVCCQLRNCQIWRSRHHSEMQV